MSESGGKRDMFGLRESLPILKCVDSLGTGLEGYREGSKLQGAAQHGWQWKNIKKWINFEMAKISLGSPWNILMAMSKISWIDRFGTQELGGNERPVNWETSTKLKVGSRLDHPGWAYRYKGRPKGRPLENRK